MNSRADQRFKPFLEKVVPAIKVGVAWEDYEKIGGRTAEADFQRKVEDSDALFLVLSRGAQFSLDAGNPAIPTPLLDAAKDIHVLEHCEDLERISIRVPRFHHFTALYITNAWTDHLKGIIGSYEGSGTAPAPPPEVALKPLAPDAVGAYFDGTGAALFDHSTSRPVGGRASCPHCAVPFILHAPSDLKIVRCPGCGGFGEVDRAS